MTATTDKSVTPEYHGLTADEALLLLEGYSRYGLTAEGAAEILARTGPNLLPTAARTSLPTRILRQIHNPLIYVLLAAGAITAAEEGDFLSAEARHVPSADVGKAHLGGGDPRALRTEEISERT